MATDCCKSGKFWPGEAVGKETEIFGRNTYTTGTNRDAVLVIIHDVFGWRLNNTRLSADYYAKHADLTVLVPDFFHGECVDTEIMDDEEKRAKFDVRDFVGRHSREAREPEIFDFCKKLKSEMGFRKLGAFGFCWGGWACFRLGARDVKLADAFAVGHPAMQTDEDIAAVGVACQIHAPEHDQTYSDLQKRYTLETVPTLGVDFEYLHYPGLVHGFATRGDLAVLEQRKGVERARSSAAAFFKVQLHES